MTTRQAGLSDVCGPISQIVLLGNEAMPLVSIAEPLVRNDRVYLPDYLGHRILVFSTSGRFLSSIGRRGDGPGEFQMPYGVAVDTTGRFYVNDRGNQRVQVFDRNHNVVRVINTPGQNEQLFVIGHSADLLLQGVTGCARAEGCLFTRYAPDGRRLDAFGEIRPPVAAYTWQAAVGRNGRLYVANILHDVVEMYTLAGGRLGSYRLASPTMRVFEQPTREATVSDMGSLRRRLQTEDYTLIRRIEVVDSFVLIQMQRKNGPPQTPEFVIDVYSETGRPLYHGIEAPGVLHVSGPLLQFVKRTDSGHGTVTISRCEFRMDRANVEPARRVAGGEANAAH